MEPILEPILRPIWSRNWSHFDPRPSPEECAGAPYERPSRPPEHKGKISAPIANRLPRVLPDRSGVSFGAILEQF